MKRSELAQLLDHTLLTATAVQSDIVQLCTQARDEKMFAVCVHPRYIELAREKLAQSGVRIATVVGFPLGANLSRVKAYETTAAIEQGADEIDMVMALSAFKDRKDALVVEDIRAVVQAAQGRCVKVIVESGWLNEAEVDRACDLCMEGGANFVKTSTGFGPGGAEPWCVERMRARVKDQLKIKASAKIRSAAQAMALVRAGADRLGTSASIEILAQVYD